MDVALISCSGCPTSQLVCERVEVVFQRMITPENQRIPIALRRFDLGALDQLQVASEVFRSKIQVLVVSRYLVENITDDGTRKKSSLSRVLETKKVIIIAAATSEPDVSQYMDSVKGSQKENWFILVLDDAVKMETSFRERFADKVIKIYNLEYVANSSFSLFPKKVSNEQPKVVVFLKKSVNTFDNVSVSFIKTGDVELVEGLIPVQALLLRMPESFCSAMTSLVEVSVSVNGEKLGTKLLKYEYQAPENRDDYIGRILKVLPSFQTFLDDHVSRALSDNFSVGRDWLQDPALEVVNDIMTCRASFLPTLMHFAANYALEKTVWTLLDDMNGFGQCSVRNDQNQTPLDLAPESIRQIIHDFHDMSKTCKAFGDFKQLITKHEVEMDCDVPEVNHGFSNEDDVSSELYVTPNLGADELRCDSPTSPGHFYVNEVIQKDLGHSVSSYENVLPQSNSPIAAGPSVDRSRVDSSQDELDGLIRDYRNDVESRRQVETILHRWSTLKEEMDPQSRHERLSQMRAELNQLEKINSSNRKNSIFSRICAFFGKKRKVAGSASAKDPNVEAVGLSSLKSPETAVVCSATVVNETDGLQALAYAQQKYMSHPDRVEWKLSPISSPKRIPEDEGFCGASPGFKASTPLAGVHRRFRPAEIRTPPETPRKQIPITTGRKTPSRNEVIRKVGVAEDSTHCEVTSLPVIPQKTVPIKAPESNQESTHQIFVGEEDLRTKLKPESRQHYYKVPVPCHVPRPVDVDSGNPGEPTPCPCTSSEIP